MVDYGATHPVESWDFQAGDIWYFPSNIGHSVVGLAPDGCAYLSVYNNGPFDEIYDSKGLSSWFSSAPPSILAQVLRLLPKYTVNLQDMSLARERTSGSCSACLLLPIHSQDTNTNAQ